MKNLNPNELTFREATQNRTAEIAELFPHDDYFPIVVISDTLEILDGHNRSRVAMDRGHLIPAVEISRADYDRLQTEGFDDMEIAYAALILEGEMDAASGLDVAFGGIVANRGIAACETL